MSSSDDTPTVCLHMMIERAEDGVSLTIIDSDNHRKLIPMFKCGNCNAVFYAILPMPRPKPVEG
jgi:hypothetical protein